MLYLAIPFKIIHRLFGAAAASLLIVSLTVLLGILVLSVLGILISAVAGAVVWGSMAFVFYVLGSVLLGIVRVFDPTYFQNKDDMAVQVYKTARKGGDDLRRMAYDHV